MKYKEIKECRISGSKDLCHIINLGNQPLANSLKKNPDDDELKVPLSISFCPESSLVQLNETVDKNILFDHYVWVTGTSKGANEYSEIFFNRVKNKTHITKEDFIIEIASNDGIFLRPFVNRGYKNILGVDPASNIVEMANKDGLPTLNDYWSIDIAKKLVHERGNAKVVFARNVIPHVEELLKVIEGIEYVLDTNGTGIIEFHHVGGIAKDVQYDSIYHEHLCFFSLKSMTYLLNRFNLFPFDVDHSPISGGSYVIYFSKKRKEKSVELLSQENYELENRVNELSKWQEFAENTKKHKDATIDILQRLKGNKIIGFGSSARSQTYLNYCGISNKDITAIIDNNPLKQELFAPGSNIPILSFSKGMAINPDVIFILAWNFRDEIIEECRNEGFKGKFLVPFPETPYFIK
jgi:hypothetical protein